MEWNTKFEWENVDIDGSFNLSGVASTESSFKDGFKGSNYSFEGSGSFPDSYNKKDSSVCSREPFIGLKLGKRTYFENGYTNNNNNNNNKKSVVLDTRKKVKSTCQSALISRCQVEGCNLDLSSAKEYHRKHRVCENHSKCPKVIVAGVERRFCQQCSRFHSMSEFDDEKRSCRKRLSDHNARRRKSQQDPICFNSTSPFSSFYGSESVDVLSHSTGVQMSDVLNMSTPSRDRLVPSKGHRAETFDHGFKESLSSNVDAVEIRRALSLLSNNTWGSYELDHHLTDSNGPTMVQHGLHVGPHDSPLSPQVYWQPNQQSIDPRIQIFKSSYENSFLFHHNG